MSRKVLYSVSMMAGILKISRQAVIKRIKAKKLPAYKIGNFWVIELIMPS